MTFWGAFNSNLHTLFKKITPKTGLLTRKCALKCNFHMVRTQFKRRIVLERIRYTILKEIGKSFIKYVKAGKCIFCHYIANYVVCVVSLL